MGESTSEQSDRTETEPIASHLRSIGLDRRAALHAGSKEAILLCSETREELARVPWWAGDDAVKEGDPVEVHGRRYTITAWGGRCVGRPAYVFVEPVSPVRGAEVCS